MKKTLSNKLEVFCFFGGWGMRQPTEVVKTVLGKIPNVNCK